MPWRDRLRSARHHFRGLSPKPPDEPTIVSPPALNAQPPQATTSTAVQAEFKDPKPFSQCLELHGCWREAYELLQEEHGDLIHAYESFLLQQGTADNAAQADPNPLPRLRPLVQDRLQEIEKSRLKITVAGKEIVIREQARRTIHAILSVKDFITTAVSTEPHAALAWAGVLLLLNPVAKSVTQDEDAMSAFEDISIILVRYRLIERTHIEIYSQKSDVSNRSPEELEASVRSQTVKMYARILEFQIRLAQHFQKTGFYRFLAGLGFSDDWKELLQPINTIDKQIIEQLNVLSQHTLKDMHLEVGKLQHQIGQSLEPMSQLKDETRETKQIQLLSTLPVSNGAAFDSEEDETKSRCLEGTQVNTLGRIQDWCRSPTSENIYWLKGMAGTGKSTLSRTVAAACHNRQPFMKGTPSPERLCLGGSFFFDQGKADRSTTTKLFTTLCKQLATSLPDTRDEICKAISNNPDIGNRGMKDQWNELILQPLLVLEKQTLLSPFTLVIVIDALDECEKSKIEGLLARFTQSQGLNTIQLKIFITSRPEAHIFSAFREMKDRCKVLEDDLHKVTPMLDANNTDDITRFLILELDKVRKKQNISSDWPGETVTTELALKADGLWIYAATASRFLQAPGLTPRQAKDCLKAILEGDTTGMTPQNKLDQIYRRILKFSVTEGATDKQIELLCGSFRKIVGCIVVLLEPLTMTALSDFLSLEPFEAEDTLHGLHSVLSINDDRKGTVKLLHLSFREFLIEEDRCSDLRFWICPKTTHYEALKACLHTLSDRLKENFYDLSHPSASPAEVYRFKTPPPLHVQYAGLHWVDHLKCSATVPDNEGQVHRFLKCHFLHWVEFMSASSKMSEVVSAVITLNEYCSSFTSKETTEVRDFTQDTRRFILKFRGIIETAPLQIYRSALIFCPERSIVRNQFRDKIPNSYTRVPVVHTEWSPLLQTFQSPGHFEDMALSPDGKMVACPSLRVWDVATGTLFKSFEPLGPGKCVKFSSDGKHLISLSDKGNLRVWDLAKDEVRQEVQSSFEVSCSFHVFSEDKTMAAFTSGTRIQLIDVSNGKAMEPLQNHSKIHALAMSSDGQLLVSGSDYGTIQIWNTKTYSRKEFRDKETRPNQFCSRVAFSSDKKVIATLSASTMIQIWDLTTENLLHTMEVGRSHDIVFLPDNQTLLSSGNTVHFWDVASGRLLKTIDAQCAGLRLSPDGKLLTKIEANDYCIGGDLQVWDTTTGALIREVEISKGGFWYQAFFSPDNSILATASTESGIHLWDLTTKSMPKTNKPNNDANEFTKLYLSPNHTTFAGIMNHSMVGLMDPDAEVFRELDKLCSTIKVSKHSDAIDNVYCTWASSYPRDGVFEYQVRMMQFSPDGNLLLTSDTTDSKFWDTTTGRLAWRLDHQSERSAMCQFSPNGNFIAHGFKREDGDGKYVHLQDQHKVGQIGEVAIWDVRTRNLLHVLNRPYQIVKGLAFSPDSSMLACIFKEARPKSSTETSVLEICDLKGGLFSKARSSPADLKLPVAWSPDGKLVACSSKGGAILFFCPETAKFQSFFDEPGWRYISALAFSPDGRFLASIQEENTRPFRGTTIEIGIWDVHSNKLLGTLEIFDETYRPNIRFFKDLRFSEDGTAIHTSFGRIDVRAFYPEPTAHEHLFLAKNWIHYGENEAMILPRDDRAVHAFAIRNTLLIQHDTGKLTIFGFGGRE